MYVIIEAQLGPTLFNRWWNAGHPGSYAGANQQTSTITYDPSMPMRLENITLAGGDKFSVILTFKLPNIAISGAASQLVHFRQLIDREPVSGNVFFRINVFPDEDQPKNRPSSMPVAQQETQTFYQLFPNPAGNTVFVRYTGSTGAATHMQVTDLSGRILLEKSANVNAGINYPLDLSPLAPGFYFITILDPKEQRTFKLTKVK